MATGTVRYFDTYKGVGFITPDVQVDDILVNYTDIMDGNKALKEGQKVEFEIHQGPKGPQAKNVKPK